LLNKFEDNHAGGIALAYPADMCSQCKTVKKGGVLKLSSYMLVTVARFIKIIWPRLTWISALIAYD
jgi:hypothetical protein